MTSTEIISPDAILSGGDIFADTETDGLSPCPSCGSHQTAAPEGVNGDGTAKWQNAHCFKCGFRPGINTAVDQTRMQQAFEAFKKYVADNNLYSHPTLNPPSATEADTLRAQLAEVQAKLAAQPTE